MRAPRGVMSGRWVIRLGVVSAGHGGGRAAVAATGGARKSKPEEEMDKTRSICGFSPNLALIE